MLRDIGHNNHDFQKTKVHQFVVVLERFQYHSCEMGINCIKRNFSEDHFQFPFPFRDMKEFVQPDWCNFLNFLFPFSSHRRQMLLVSLHFVGFHILHFSLNQTNPFVCKYKQTKPNERIAWQKPMSNETDFHSNASTTNSTLPMSTTNTPIHLRFVRFPTLFTHIFRFLNEKARKQQTIVAYATNQHTNYEVLVCWEGVFTVFGLCMAYEFLIRAVV